MVHTQTQGEFGYIFPEGLLCQAKVSFVLNLLGTHRKNFCWKPKVTQEWYLRFCLFLPFHFSIFYCHFSFLQELNLPVKFLSGKIHELRIHVPWTRITYEPVIIKPHTVSSRKNLSHFRDFSSFVSILHRKSLCKTAICQISSKKQLIS